jgi:hypothetical protein
MPNLFQIVELHKRYKPDSDLAKINLTEAHDLAEAINPSKIEKAIKGTIEGISPKFAMYFHFNFKVEVVLIFIDICSFSTRFSDLPGENLKIFFDEYYDLIIPIIYKNGGEIDKIIGDGIICFFGEPFSEGEIDFQINQAFICCKEIIEKTINTEFYSKIAIHNGDILYYKNGSGDYQEYTMIGKPITELFRLESISKDKRINFYSNSKLDSFLNQKIKNDTVSVNSKSKWILSNDIEIKPRLKGVDDFTHIKTLYRY